MRLSSLAEMASSSSSIDQFIEFLSQEPRWYTLGIFLGAPTPELHEIERKYRETEGIMRCLSELYECLQRKGKSLSWEIIATALKKMGNNGLAEKVLLENISKSNTIDHDMEPPEPRPPSSHCNSTTPSPPSAEGTIEVDVQPIRVEYESLVERLGRLRNDIKAALRNANADLEVVQDLIEDSCCLEPLPQDQATLNNIFRRLKKHCSILNFRVLVHLVESLLKKESHLLKELNKFMESVNGFKKSAKILEVVTLLKNEVTPIGGQKLVKLKVRQFWSELKVKEFEVMIADIFETLYDIIAHITVTKGCLCFSWILPPNISTSKLLIPELSLEFIRLIGVISLHIGDNLIYNIEGDGCETIEAAMLQAIELKNTRAIEVLLAAGCNVEVATFNGNNTVTNIVNIRTIESKESTSSAGNSGGGVDYMCILGHDEHVEAIVNPSDPAEQEFIEHLYQLNEMLRDMLRVEKMKHEQMMKEKDIEIEYLRKTQIEPKVKVGDRAYELDKPMNYGSTGIASPIMVAPTHETIMKLVKLQHDVDSPPPLPPKSKHKLHEQPSLTDDNTGDDSGHDTGSGFTNVVPFLRSKSLPIPSSSTSPRPPKPPPKPVQLLRYTQLDTTNRSTTVDGGGYTQLLQTNMDEDAYTLMQFSGNTTVPPQALSHNKRTSQESELKCYKDVLFRIACRLTDTEGRQIALIHGLEQIFQEEKPFSVLIQLERKQIISEAKPECLVEVLRMIHREDLARDAKFLSVNLKIAKLARLNEVGRHDPL